VTLFFHFIFKQSKCPQCDCLSACIYIEKYLTAPGNDGVTSSKYNQQGTLDDYKKFELMLTRRAKDYSSSGPVV